MLGKSILVCVNARFKSRGGFKVSGVYCISICIYIYLKLFCPEQSSSFVRMHWYPYLLCHSLNFQSARTNFDVCSVWTSLELYTKALNKLPWQLYINNNFTIEHVFTSLRIQTNHLENTEKEMKDLIETEVMGKIKIGGLEKRKGREVGKKMREDEISKVNMRHSDFF